MTGLCFVGGCRWLDPDSQGWCSRSRVLLPPDSCSAELGVGHLRSCGLRMD